MVRNIEKESHPPCIQRDFVDLLNGKEQVVQTNCTIVVILLSYTTIEDTTTSIDTGGTVV